MPLSATNGHRSDLMMSPPEIRREEENAISVAQELASRLRKFNEERAGPLGWKPVTLSIRNESGDIIAGLSGEFFWNTLFVDILWVDEAYRGHDYGSRLLRCAEQEGVRQGYDLVYLSTFSFQAPGFYLKQGYTVIGELDGSPRLYKRQWFAKRIA